MADTRALTDIIEQVSDGIIVSDLDGVVTYVNDAVVRITGSEKGDLVGGHLSRFHSEIEALELLPTLLEQGFWEGEMGVRQTDNRVCHVGLHLTLLKDRRGNPLGIIGIARDVTEKRSLEEKLHGIEAEFQRVIETGHKEKKELERELVLYYNAFRNSTHGMVITDLGGAILGVNESFVRIFGYSAEELIGRTASLLRSSHSTDELFRQMWESLEKKDEWRGEIINRRKDGSEVPTLLSITPIYDGAKRKIGYMGVEIDITGRKRLEQQIDHSEKLATVGQLAAGIAHEIGTPLGVISGYAEYLLMDLKKDDGGYEELKIIISQTERIAKLIQQILDFARPKRLLLKSVNLSNEIEAVLTMVQYQLDKSKIVVTTDLARGLPVIFGDAGQLQQVFLNIIMNSIQAMERGGELKVETGVIRKEGEEDSGQKVMVRVSDKGCGIPEENLGRIFDPFFTTKEMGKGTGLGLAVAQRIVFEHKGMISVESKVNFGTTFTLTFPVHDTKEERL
jgi:PAS domain S-box-containing protein